MTHSNKLIILHITITNGRVIMFKKNCCDGIYNSFDVHFTSACDNNCAHCIDMRFSGMGINKPDPLEIADTIIMNQEGYDDVLFLGGEPCLYLDDLIECVKQVKIFTDLKIFVTTAVPKICLDERKKFEVLLHWIDGINLSVQHYDEKIANKIRRGNSNYNRQSFYNSLPLKEKIRINLNIVKPYLYTKEDLTACLKHYDKMRFNSIKLSEIQHGKEHYVSFEEVFGVKLGSPYFSGCQKYLNMDKIIPNFKTPVLLKRSCFACEETLKASFMDGVKVLYNTFINRSKNKFSVVYGDGTLKKGWI